MRVLVVGASGTIGSAVASAFDASGHEVLRGGRQGDVRVDISDARSIATMYEQLGKVDGVVCCAGAGAFASLSDLTDEQIQSTLGGKLLGQVNLVRSGLAHVNDGGVFVLTSGIFSQRPIPGVSALAMANGAIESFVKAAALDLPRGIRIGALSPPFITETAQKMGMPTTGTLSAAEAARAYVAFATGRDTGAVLFPGS
jgi:NAD(P)-dependent dehydrogenase (short-subunit alcohol dehydrogenase family)